MRNNNEDWPACFWFILVLFIIFVVTIMVDAPALHDSCYYCDNSGSLDNVGQGN